MGASRASARARAALRGARRRASAQRGRPAAWSDRDRGRPAGAARRCRVGRPRIGITKATELPWRFCATGSRCRRSESPRALAGISRLARGAPWTGGRSRRRSRAVRAAEPRAAARASAVPGAAAARVHRRARLLSRRPVPPPPVAAAGAAACRGVVAVVWSLPSAGPPPSATRPVAGAAAWDVALTAPRRAAVGRRRPLSPRTRCRRRSVRSR